MLQTDSLSRYDAAFRELAPRRTGLARRVVGDASEAEDVVQEAFVRLENDPVLAQPPEQVAAWLGRVTLNLAFNRQRDTRRWRERAERGGRLALDRSSDEPMQAVLRKEQRLAVRRSLAQLPEKQRNSLLLRHAGYSYAEVAAALGIPPGSVGTTLARAERAFRLLHEENFNDLS